MERLVEMHEMRHTSAADLCRRLGTLADLSPSMFLTTVRLGSGDVHAVRQSFAEMAEVTGRTRQALHYEWSHEVAKVRMAGLSADDEALVLGGSGRRLLDMAEARVAAVRGAHG